MIGIAFVAFIVLIFVVGIVMLILPATAQNFVERVFGALTGWDERSKFRLLRTPRLGGAGMVVLAIVMLALLATVGPPGG